MAVICVLLAALAGLTACQSQKAEFLPESSNAEMLVVLPEDWQWLENWQAAEDVPRLLLVQGDTVIEPMNFNPSWCFAVPGTSELNSYIACGVHPLEMQAELPRLAAEPVQLVWQAVPTEFSVTAYAYDEWQQRTCGNTAPEEVLHTELEVAADGSFALLADEHSYVYVIAAQWQLEDEPLGGGAEWAFSVE